MIDHMIRRGISSLTTGGPTLSRSLTRKELPNSKEEGFMIDSRTDAASFEYVDRFLVEKTEDGWKPVTDLPTNGVNRHDVEGKYGVWQDESVSHKSFPLVGKTIVDEKPDGKLQPHEVRPFEYGAVGGAIGGRLLAAEILSGADDDSFTLRATGQPEAETLWERGLGLGKSSVSHHQAVVADDQFWVLRD